MSGVQGAKWIRHNSLKYCSNRAYGATCQVHMPHVVADVELDADHRRPAADVVLTDQPL